MKNKTTKDIIYLIIDTIATILIIISTFMCSLYSIRYGYNMKEQETSTTMSINKNRKLVQRVDAPELSYNTYYLITWKTSNGSFASPSLGWDVRYYLDSTLWYWDKLPDDTLLISTYDNELIYINDFIAEYGEFAIELSITSKDIVPYVQIMNFDGDLENFNILLSLNTFLNQPNYRYLSLINNRSEWTSNIIYSSLNSGENIENIIISWNQPYLIQETLQVTNLVGTNSNLFLGFIQPYNIQQTSTPYDVAYNDGYVVGHEEGLRTGLGFFSIVESATNSIHNIFSIEIIPGLTLATMLGVFIGLPLFFFFMKMISAR